MSALQDWERAIYTLSVQRPQPAIPTYRKKEEKGKTIEDKRGESNLGQSKRIAFLLKPDQSAPHTLRKLK